MSDLNTVRMLRDIDKLVNNDWAADMETKTLDTKPFTQKEAKEMAKTIGKVYSISHALHCVTCSLKYRKKP